MSKQVVSPMCSPQKEKPKISFRYSPSPLKQRQNQNNQVKAQSMLKVATKNYLTERKNHQNQRLQPVETHQERFGFQSIQVPTGYLSNTSQNQNTIVKNDIIPKKCQKCNKRKSSYFTVTDKLRLCSNCAIQQMKNGKEVRQLRIQQKFLLGKQQQKLKQDKNVSFQAQKTSNFKNNFEQQNIHKSQDVIKKYRQMLQIEMGKLQTNQKINEKYNKYRQQLKQHYERLKEVIQQAIKRDLENIKCQQETQQKKTVILRQEINRKLDQISLKNDISCMKIIVEDFQTFQKRIQKDLQQQLNGFQLKKIVQLQKQNNIKSLYHPNTFMLTSNNNNKIGINDDHKMLALPIQSDWRRKESSHIGRTPTIMVTSPEGRHKSRIVCDGSLEYSFCDDHSQ